MVCSSSQSLRPQCHWIVRLLSLNSPILSILSSRGPSLHPLLFPTMWPHPRMSSKLPMIDDILNRFNHLCLVELPGKESNGTFVGWFYCSRNSTVWLESWSDLHFQFYIPIIDIISIGWEFFITLYLHPTFFWAPTFPRRLILFFISPHFQNAEKTNHWTPFPCKSSYPLHTGYDIIIDNDHQNDPHQHAKLQLRNLVAG